MAHLEKYRQGHVENKEQAEATAIPASRLQVQVQTLLEAQPLVLIVFVAVASVRHKTSRDDRVFAVLGMSGGSFLLLIT